ncbi:TM2 domain-containing protein 2 [Lingula anatina]|uniref:TM2 domain-containing protein 2 n=1 Tax=Lingula anatina TaxID=7574 RepID=A0A1S3I3P1_LINAN|nr:TM2 domain-containing protein 2 [Lingula anatina]|eukprot:XP_013392853.1 TM2 domain-containing protein 2 [Lingula anatina]
MAASLRAAVVSLFFILLQFVLILNLQTDNIYVPIGQERYSEEEGYHYNPEGPLVLCEYLPEEFIGCEEPTDHDGNLTARDELGYGCVKWGGQKYDEVEKTKVVCRVLDYIECFGNRTFFKDGVPCIKYTGHYFVVTLIYSVLLGFLGIDRFCLGHTGTAVGKLMTLGGVGIWWIVDIILLVTGQLLPEDGSNWMPNY